MIDKELVTRKIVLITDDLKALEPLGRKALADYLASAIDEVLAERYLERIIGRMIDINYHVLTESGQAPPKDYYPSFTALGDAGARSLAGGAPGYPGLPEAPLGARGVVRVRRLKAVGLERPQFLSAERASLKRSEIAR